MEDYGVAILRQLDFEPTTDRMRRHHPGLVSAGYRAGGLACFAAVYPIAELGSQVPNNPWPAYAAAAAYAGWRCLREAARSTLPFAVQAELQAPDSA